MSDVGRVVGAGIEPRKDFLRRLAQRDAEPVDEADAAIGRNARDLEHFVRLLDMSPLEAIQACTKLGGEIMQMGGELGLVKEGYLADLLLVDGDPSVDVTILQDRARFLAIMKDGAFHKRPPARPAAAVRAAE